MNSNEIKELIKKYRQQIIDLVCDLVNIPTENNPPNGNELEGQNFLKAIFEKLNFQTDEFAPDEIEDFHQNPAFLKGRCYSNRKNLVATWKGNGGGKSIVLSGHMDVAPKEPLPWNICQPFQSIIKYGRIYGRGSADMKAGLASAVMAVKILRDMGWQPKGDIIIESVVDEEYASGNGTIASRFRGYNADFGIKLEASGLRICPSCVGGLIYKVSILGVAGMPYTGGDIYNPVYDIADIIGIIKEYEKVRLKDVKVPELWENAVQQPKIILTKIKAGEVQPHGQLSTPIDSWLELVIQTYPGETEQDVTEDFKQFVKSRFSGSGEILIEREYHYIEPGSCDKSFEGIGLLKDCADNYLDGPAIVCGAPFSCDLFAFKKYGSTNAVIFGPVGGNLHAPDEWVDIDSVLTTTKVLIDFIVKWCS
jgi:acetylornithine deacetylase